MIRERELRTPLWCRNRFVRSGDATRKLAGSPDARLYKPRYRSGRSNGEDEKRWEKYREVNAGDLKRCLNEREDWYSPRVEDYWSILVSAVGSGRMRLRRHTKPIQQL